MHWKTVFFASEQIRAADPTNFIWIRNNYADSLPDPNPQCYFQEYVFIHICWVVGTAASSKYCRHWIPFICQSKPILGKDDNAEQPEKENCRATFAAQCTALSLKCHSELTKEKEKYCCFTQKWNNPPKIVHVHCAQHVSASETQNIYAKVVYKYARMCPYCQWKKNTSHICENPLLPCSYDRNGEKPLLYKSFRGRIKKNQSLVVHEPHTKKRIRTRTSIRRCTITYGGVILYIAKEITPSSMLMCTVSFASATCKAYAAVTCRDCSKVLILKELQASSKYCRDCSMF